jgi:glycosyltransferase involved in cell wall biosynthesis
MTQLIVENELTILMPCLNEEGTISKCIAMAFDSIRKNGLSAEVLIADNGSTDNSVSIAEKLGARVVSVKEKGYGSALKAGIKEANGKYIIMGDSDCSYDFGEISLFIDRLREGYDLVMGNRFKGGIKDGAMPFLHRYVGNPILSFIGRLFFQSSIGDFHCGLRGFNRQSIINIGLTTTGMEFASEMVVKATLNKLKITEVPTILYPDERNKPPHLNTWSDGWRHLRFLLIYSPRWLFLFPGIFMLLAGLLFSVIIGLKQVSVNHVNFDVHTLLYSITFFYIGYQFVSFYIFTRYFGVSNGLLPHSKRFEKFLYYLKLERGIFIGLFFLLTGILFSVHALQIWKESGFGGLNPSEVFRIVIPASFSIIVGMQTILNSFFLSILGLKKKE